MNSPRSRLSGWRSGLVWLIVGLDLTVVAARYIAVPLTPDMPAWAVGVFIGMVATLGVVGALVVTRQPRNAVGWILWLAACLVALAIVSDVANYRTATDGVISPWEVVLAWVGGFMFVPPIGMVVVFVPMLFPDGRLPSPRWRWVAVFSAAALVVSAIPSMFTPGPLPNAQVIMNPLGIPGFDQAKPILDMANLLMVGIAFPLAIAASVIRYRRGTSVERQQLKWFAAAVGVTVVAFLSAVTQISPLAEIGWVLGLFGIALLPVAIGIAILRYHLYDIDRIISRTIAYLIVTGILAAVFVGAVLVSRAVLGQFLGENPVGVAASTLIVAALFQPLRRRVQTRVDRRFDRARYDGQRTAEAFTERLRDQVDLATLAADLRATVDANLRPASASVWLREPHRVTP